MKPTKHTQRRIGHLLAFTILLVSLQVSATPIAILNHDFESDAAENGNNASVSDWIEENAEASFTADWTNGRWGPTGMTQVGYVTGTAGAAVNQDLAHNWAVDDRYTLTIDMFEPGWRVGVAGDAIGVQIREVGSGTVLWDSGAQNVDDTMAGTENNLSWGATDRHFTFTFNAADFTGGTPGTQINIRVYRAGGVGWFDNISLDVVEFRDCDGDGIDDRDQLEEYRSIYRSGLDPEDIEFDYVEGTPEVDGVSVLFPTAPSASDVTIVLDETLASWVSGPDPNEYLLVYVKNTLIGRAFESPGEDTFVIPQATWETLRNGAQFVKLTVEFSVAATPELDGVFVLPPGGITVSYSMDRDINDNGWLDDCIPDGDPTGPDSDGDGVSDNIDRSPNTIADPSLVDVYGQLLRVARFDADEDGDVDVDDFDLLDAAARDVDGDGDADLHDLASILHSARGPGAAADPAFLQELQLFKAHTFGPEDLDIKPWYKALEIDFTPWIHDPRDRDGLIQPELASPHIYYYANELSSRIYGTHLASIDKTGATPLTQSEQISQLHELVAASGSAMSWIGLRWHRFATSFIWENGQIFDPDDPSNPSQHAWPSRASIPGSGFYTPGQDDYCVLTYNLPNGGNAEDYQWQHADGVAPSLGSNTVEGFVAQLPANTVAAAPATTTETVTVTLDSTFDGQTIAPGQTVDWTISFEVSSGDNSGLALLVTDLEQDASNPGTFDLPAGDAAPVAMQNFAAPLGFTGPGGYGGEQSGTAGALDLVQIGGAQNTFGGASSDPTQGQGTTVVTGIGQSGSTLLASGSFTAPATEGTYTFTLANTLASVLKTVGSAGEGSEIVPANLTFTQSSISFEVLLQPLTVSGPSTATIQAGDDLVQGDVFDLASIIQGSTSWTLLSNSNPGLVTPAINQATGKVTLRFSSTILDDSATLVFRGTNAAGQFGDWTVTVSTSSPIFVDLAATGANDGSNWANAFIDLQSALSAAVSGDQIWVSKGRYLPGATRDATFALVDGVKIYGGFSGVEFLAGQRDPAANPTILSGDVDDNDLGADGIAWSPADVVGSNAYHVVTAPAGLLPTTVLDGLIITAGQADGPLASQQSGGGLHSTTNRIVVANCRFMGNQATNQGGGACLMGITSGQRLINGSFAGNTANEGAGVALDGARALFYSCRFSGNSATSAGGGVALTGNSTGIFASCTVSGNGSGGDGGGVACSDSTLEAANTIVWGNAGGTPSSLSQSGTTNLFISYSLFEDLALGDMPFAGSTDPLFVSPVNLASLPTSDGDLRLGAGSPLIDQADAFSLGSDTADLDRDGITAEPHSRDLRLLPRIMGSGPDVGAYETRPILHVDADVAGGTGDGSDWVNAFPFLQDALDAADAGAEIRVAGGTYHPDDGASVTANDPDAVFRMANDVVLFGGYAGGGMPSPDDRDPNTWPSILSGDLGDDDGALPVGINSSHVVAAEGVDKTAILDGFSVSGGVNFVGSALVCFFDSAPLISNCRFTGNHSTEDVDISDPLFANYTSFPGAIGATWFQGHGVGGCVVSIQNFAGGTDDPVHAPGLVGPTFLDCVLSNNSSQILAEGGWAPVGVGLASATLDRSAILDNDATAASDGGAGGLICTKSNVNVRNCRIFGNSGVFGAVIAFDNGSSVFANTLISGNAGDIGGMYVSGSSGMRLINSTVAGNDGNVAGGIYADLSSSDDLVLDNCLVWNNGVSGDVNDPESSLKLASSSPTINDSMIQHVVGGSFTAGDVFVSPMVPTSAPATGGDYRLVSGSPAIDAGNTDILSLPDGRFLGVSINPFGALVSSSATDLDGEARLFGSAIDLGAYEYLPSASVAGRHVFYNGSTFDEDAGAGVNDDNAIASDKSALLPGGGATFDNYTSYSKGINGIMVDIAGLPGTPTASDFTFKTGNDNDPTGWASASDPSIVSVRAGAGTGGSDRVTLIWNDNNLDATVDANEAVVGAWLEVTVLATANTGLSSDEVFYFGNAIGETGNDASSARVNTADVLLIRNNPKTFLDPADITDPHDLNRDTKVNTQDRLLARNHKTTFLDELKLIDLSGGASSTSFEPADTSLLRRTGSAWGAAMGTLDGRSVLTFQGPAGAGYEVYASPRVEGGWELISGEIIETGPGRFQLDHAPVEGGTLFYRIVPVIYEEDDVFPSL